MNDFRIGHGYDVHALADGLPLRLGGVLIEHPRGCVAHSDGDALIHALCDALLGAAAMGDIGLHFPDTSERFKGIDSRILLRHTVEMLRDKGYRIGNVDCTLCLQRPKIKPYIAAMRETLAETMGIDPERVSVKATTTEPARIRRPGRGSRGSCRRAGLQGNPIAKTLPGRQSSPRKRSSAHGRQLEQRKAPAFSETGRRNGNSGFSAEADSLPSRQRERAYPISPIRQPGTGWNRLSRFPKTKSACRTASENQRKRNESPMTDKRDARGRAPRISFIRPSAERIPATAAILTGRQPS